MAYPPLIRKGGINRGATSTDDVELLGRITDLTTTNKNNLVAAVNEVKQELSSIGGADIHSKPSLLIYYGYPIAYKGIWNTDGVIAGIAKYNYYVCGDTYQDPTHEEYASTTTIVAGVRTNGTKVYGYVPIGVSTSALTIAQIKTRIDQWVALGVDGIFLDEFGFDYQVTRSRQIEIVEYVKSKNLPYCANAWTFEDVVCANVSELSWPTNDWRYINFTTYNPTNIALPFDSNDSYLIESFCFSEAGALGRFDAQERYQLIRNRNNALPNKLVIWAETVFKEKPVGSGNIDTAKIGSLAVSDLGNYIVANAYIFDIDVLGIGGYSFGSGGTPVEITIPKIPSTVKFSYPLPTEPVVNLTTGICSRNLNTEYTISIKNLSGITVTVSDAAGSTLKNVPYYDPMLLVDNVSGGIYTVDYVLPNAAALTSGAFALGTTQAGVNGETIVANNQTATVLDVTQSIAGNIYTLTAGVWTLTAAFANGTRRTIGNTSGINNKAGGAVDNSSWVTLEKSKTGVLRLITPDNSNPIRATKIGKADALGKPNTLDNVIGNMSTITTDAKTSLIAAINEINAESIDFMLSYTDARDGVTP